jgi:DHA3 family tetracycline resistance protein-like MFS transporter
MHHSYESLDRPGGSGAPRGGILTPLRDRDFRLLWIGATASLVGDGAFLVALAWQVYVMSGGPGGMSLVGIAMTVPTITFLLVGGVASDRLERRWLLVGADLLRALAVGLLAGLTIGGQVELWHVVVLSAAYGTGSAFHAPAFDALVPELLAGERLTQANALDQLMRPLALRLAGPALGGVVVGVAGAGGVFLLDSATFLMAAGTVLLMAPARADRAVADGGSLVADLQEGDPSRAGVASSFFADLREGWRFVRGHTWLWATFASAAVAYLLFMGPVEVLLPWVVKEGMGGSAFDLGLVFAAGGLASMLCAVLLGRFGLPRRSITFMMVAWTLATLAVAGYGAASAIWQLMIASAVFNALETAGTIVWATTKQRHVPSALLGRVSSLDWLISVGLLPLSFALTGPVNAAIGARDAGGRRRARRDRHARRAVRPGDARAGRPRGPRRPAPPRGRGAAARAGLVVGGCVAIATGDPLPRRLRHPYAGAMAVKRIVADLHATDPAASRGFYEDVVGLEVVMDLGWILTFAAPQDRGVQLSVMADDASAPVAPDVSIEVDDVEAAHAAAVARGDEIVHPLTDEPWGVRRFFVRDPGGKVINILTHQ